MAYNINQIYVFLFGKEKQAEQRNKEKQLLSIRLHTDLLSEGKYHVIRIFLLGEYLDSDILQNINFCSVTREDWKSRAYQQTV